MCGRGWSSALASLAYGLLATWIAAIPSGGFQYDEPSAGPQHPQGLPQNHLRDSRFSGPATGHISSANPVNVVTRLSELS
jgi:hypothetical protein